MRYYSIDAKRELELERLEVRADLRGHHLALQCACAFYEHVGGLIKNCRRWSDNRWRHFAGLTKRTLRRLEGAGLVRWIDDHLLTQEFNEYGLQVQLERRFRFRKSAKLRWSGDAHRTQHRNAKDRSATGDPGGDRSGRVPIATAKPSSSSSIEVVDAGGGGLPDGVWERIWSELPNRRGYWKRGAREAIEAVVVPSEVGVFLEFLNRGNQSRSWKASPPTPLTIASEFRERRRPPATRKRATEPTGPRVPSRAEIRATWEDVAKRSRGKETGT
jgi:hypothetical protein